MKAFIHIFRENEEISITALSTNQAMNLETSIREFTRNNGCISRIFLLRYNAPVGLDISEEFLNKYKNKKIKLNPEGFLKSISVQFEHINEYNDVCNCFDVYCDNSCGVLPCGCIDVCRCHDY